MTNANSGPREDYTSAVITIAAPPAPGQPYPLQFEIPGGRWFPPVQLSLDLPALQALLAQPEDFGRALGQLLFADDTLGKPFGEALAVTQGRGDGLRVRLLVEAPELQGLPWERLFQFLDGEWLPLGATAATPFSRYIRPQQWNRPQPLNRRPLRVLAVIASPGDIDRAKLDPITPAERQSLRDTFSRLPDLQVTYLESGSPTPASLDEIRKALAEGYDFVHFLCHGVHRKAGTALFLEDAHGKLEVVTAERLVGAFKAVQQPPVFTFLTACESAARASADGFLPLGPALVEDGGVQAVVAMTGRVGVELAHDFTRQFYTRLLTHGLVDLAVNEARALVRDEWDWGVPVLFSRLDDNRLLETGPSVAKLIARCLAASQKERTVVGSKYIPRLYMPLADIEQSFSQFLDHSATCFLVVAKAGRGKTNLVCHLADTHQAGRPVLFLSGRYQEPEDEQDILRYIARRLEYPDDDWQACLDDLGRAAGSGPAPLILVDGINESPARPAKMQAALRELLFEASRRGIKICVTCRTDFWQFFRADFWREYVWQEDQSHHEIIRGKDITPFAEEIYDQVRERYFEYFMIEGSLVDEAWERCRNPLLLRFFCEAYDGRPSGGRNVGEVAEIRLYPLFVLFWKQKMASVQDRLGDQLASQAVSDFILAVAGLMHRSHRTTVNRREVAGALDSDIRAMLAPDSLYVRTLDEEIIIEEETNSLTSSANVFFVYDKFSEFAISLHIYQNQGWQEKTPEQIQIDTRSLMQEETESEFATLRGALEFLVWELEDQRADEDLHFQVIDAMLDQDWKWRRIGALLAFQLLYPEKDGFWSFLTRLVGDQREFVRRMCAGQLPLLARRFAPQAIPLLFQYLDDPSLLVQQAAHDSLRSLDPASAIQAVQYLQAAPLDEEEKHGLVIELLLSPHDSLSLPLQIKARWLVHENTDADLQAVVLDYFSGWGETDIDLFELEEMERLFQVDWTREQQPRNAYLDALEGELAPRRAALAARLDDLQNLLDVLNQMVSFLAGSLELRPSQADQNLILTFEDLVSPADYETFLDQISAHFEVVFDLSQSAPNQAAEILAALTPLQLAATIAGAGDPQALVIEDWEPDQQEGLLGFYRIARLLLDQVALLAGQSRSAVKVSTPFGKDGLALDAGTLAQLFADYGEKYDLDLPATVRRSLTCPGRLLFWLAEARELKQALEEEIGARTEDLAALDGPALRRRLAEYNAPNLPEPSQRALAQDLQALLRACTGSDLKRLADALEPSIQWHHDQDSPVLSQAFAGLFWRERGRIWSLASELLQHEDQRVVDFASQILEQIEYSQGTELFESVMDRVRAIVVDLLGVDPASVSPESSFEADLDADSLDFVELIMSFEDEFGGEISDEDAMQLKTVGDVAQYLVKMAGVGAK